MEKPETLASTFGLGTPNKSRLPSNDSVIAAQQLIGLEFEVENCRENYRYYIGLLSDSGFGVTTDGSLRGNAFEFVSVPMTIGQASTQIPRFFQDTEFTEENFTDRCSIHVHANVLDMTQDSLSSLALVYQTVEDILFKFVGADRDTNLYCIPWNQCKMNHNLIAKIFVDPYHTLRSWQKYTALNLKPITAQGTVEFRHMHGTSDQVKILTWIQIIGSIMEYAKKHPLEEVIKTIQEMNTSSNYMGFFEEVFRGLLPYDAEYRMTLEMGVINAKYSLLDWTVEKKPKKKEKKAFSEEGIIETIEVFADTDGPADIRGREEAPRNPARFFNYVYDPTRWTNAPPEEAVQHAQQAFNA